jgi:capsular polysaccharide transport system permease protein
VFNALKIQSRVIHALILRETRTRFDRNKLGYLWALFEPVSFILVLVAMFSAMGKGSPIGTDQDLPLFFLTGMIPWLFFSNTVNATMAGIEGNRALLAYPQVKPFDVLLARALLEFATLTVVFVFLLLMFAYFGIYRSIDSFLGLFAAVVSLWLFAIGVGCFNATVILFIPSYKQTYAVIQRPFFFVSGIFFTVDSLPEAVRWIALYNPILHAIEWFRSAYFQSYESAYLDIQYLWSFVLIGLAVGLASLHKNREYARQTS